MSPDWGDLFLFYSLIALGIAAVVAAFAAIVAAIFFLVYRLPLALVRRRSIQCPHCNARCPKDDPSCPQCGGNLRPKERMAEVGDERGPR